MSEYNITKDVFNYMVKNFVNTDDISTIRLTNKELKNKYNGKINIKHIIKNGWLGILKHIIIEKWENKFMWYAIKYGKWDIVEWLSSQILNTVSSTHVLTELLKKIINAGVPHLNININENKSYIYLCLENIVIYNKKYFSALAKRGNLYGIKWLYQIMCIYDESITNKYLVDMDSNIIINALKYGHKNIIEWILTPEIIEYLHSHHKYGFGSEIMTAAAIYGDLDTMKWLKDMKFYSDQDTFSAAAKNGNLENMKWLNSIGCKPNLITFIRAVGNGNVDNMRWLKSIGCMVSSGSMWQAIKNNNLYLAKILHEEFSCPRDSYIYYGAIKEKNVEAIKFLYNIGCPLIVYDEYILENCIKANDLSVFKCLYELGYNFNRYIIQGYIRKSKNECKIEILEWMKEIGGEILEKEVLYACEGCTTDIFLWIYQNSGQKNMKAEFLECAIICNNLQVARILLENGCEINNNIFYYASEKDDLDYLKLLIEFNCKFTVKQIYLYRKQKETEALIRKYYPNIIIGYN
ncbi:Ankyrin-repeat protein [Orpheovirus IHUMI-LCC2]|uniref:Ankyrin-repeat protein n=1 Tax=Orpheovirus IHUMI-LCC2 TaxID=2023057 RepID=A0A2I2L4X6_9VIRU|nr:Ankyrin-repeat protein [Orpheovirus IHUMI-LCC2]SNW62577.1 Ankyrin-repeat protein [Orpheovirus IHUMI-LCC2]